MVYLLRFLRMALPRALASRWLGAPGFYGDFKSWDEAGEEIEKRGGKKPDDGLIPHSFRMPIR
jgi:hypothetical protein